MHRVIRVRWIAGFILLLPLFAFAHGLLLDARHIGDRIEGTVYYTNGELAVGEPVELLDLSVTNGTAVPAETDDVGKFSFPVRAGHRYRISAYAGEGHGVDIEIEATANSRPKLIETDAAAEQSWMPPAWAVIGLLLIASMVPVVISRRRNASSPTAS